MDRSSNLNGLNPNRCAASSMIGNVTTAILLVLGIFDGQTFAAHSPDAAFDANAVDFQVMG
jgi:hypothetical protein